MRILAAHLKLGDRLYQYDPDRGAIVPEEIVELRQDPDAATILTSSGRLVTIGADRTVEITDRRDTLLG